VCEHTFVRWDNLRIDGERHTHLPGYREPAVVRHFDAPEALDTRFYEVRAKSALNKVPERSRMPFRWTINPYRGCSHACVYCLSGDTPILTADGRARALADLEVGDHIYGTVRDGPHRRVALTEVRAHWSTVKPAYRVALADGTELIVSGDHRFLTTRGWEYVTGTQQGAPPRPRLTPGSRLLGVGGFAAPPAATDDYRRGYLCGLIRGDRDAGSYPDERAGRANGDAQRVPPACADEEAVRRALDYLQAGGLAVTGLASAAAADRRGATGAIRASARSTGDRVGDLIRWPLSPSDDWRKGFLAGLFDAGGSCSRGVLRIPGTDPATLGWTTASLSHLGFDPVLEPPRGVHGQRTVRLRSGIAERMRFFHLTDPAIARKRRIAGAALEVAAATSVAEIEPLGTAMRLYDITTGTGDFIADGVVSHNCFARPTHTYLDMDARRDFEREIVVKVNAPEILRAELGRPSWKGEHVALGTNTDPYQWVEGRYKLMRGIWEALRDHANPCSVLTKSPLLLRDVDLMVEIARVADIAANLSIPTMDEKPWRASEPHTPSPKARIEAVAELNRAGIPTGVLVAPLMPGINDDPRQVERILEAAAEAGAVGVSGIALHLRGEVRQIFMEWLRSYRPDLVERYEALYRRGAYAPRDEQDRLRRILRTTRARTVREPPRRTPADSRGVRREAPGTPGDRPPDGSQGAGIDARPARAGRQEALF
jgi:DNA repair photolyase